MTSATSSQFYREITEQPQSLQRLLEEGRESTERAAALVREHDPEWVLIAARGSSDNAARYAQYLLGAHNGLAVGLALPSLFSLYGAKPRLARALVIGISQSGQSPDIVAVLAGAREQGALTLAITNDDRSPLASAAASTLPLLAGEERAVAATKTYTSELIALALLSSELEGNREHARELQQVPELVSQVIDLASAAAEHAAQRFAGAQKLVVLGRGFNYSTAFELALKIKETCYIVAEPYSVADFLHGPIAILEQRFPVLVVAPSGRATVEVPELMELLASRGASTLAISDLDGVLSSAQAPIRLPHGVPEWLSPVTAVVAGQLFAHALCRASGQDPDRPRGLSKVTLTR
jgi:glucosamine--fructose-6-phosphate aminotransferase (isomerizing)